MWNHPLWFCYLCGGKHRMFLTKKKYDGLTPSTLYFILVTFLTFDNLYGQGQRDYLGNERLIKHFG